MLYVCIPTYNEAVTVGVLLWRLRTTLREQAGARDYEVVVYDDASTDATAELLAPYAQVLPLTVLRGAVRAGQTAAVDTLVRHVVGRSHAPDTDALLFVQADYTDAPDLVGELLPLFDAGADIVLTRRAAAPDQPLGERRLRRAASVLLPPLLRSAVTNEAARDPLALLSTLRLFRVAVLRDAVASLGSAPLVRAPGWAGTAELLVRTAPFAHRIERVEAPARYDVRTRESRIEWVRELRAVAAVLWRQRNAPRSVPRREPSAEPRVPRPRIAARTATAPAAHENGPAASVAVDLDDVGMPAVTAVPEADPSDTAAAPPRPSRRRRRSRGRPTTTDAVDPTLTSPATPDAPTDAETRGASSDVTPPNSTMRDAARDARADAPDGTDEGEATDPDGSPAAPARRRRRRGGARRRARGPESDMGVSPDLGVSPENPDSSATPRQGAPSDQPSS